MFSRRSFGKLLASAAASLGFKGVVDVKAAPVVNIPKPNIPTYLNDFQKFTNTSYLERMDLKSVYSGYDETLWGSDNLDYHSIYKKGGLERKISYINKQVLEFREQEPIKITGKPLKPLKDCWREAVAEVNAKYGIKD